MAKSVQLKDAIWIFIAGVWSAACYATERITLAQGLSSIPLQDIGLALGLAIGGGFTGTLIKLAKENHGVKKLWLEIIKDLMSALLAGTLAYLGSIYIDNVSAPLQAIAILFAGLGGSKLLEIAMDEGIVAWLRGFINWFLRRQPGSSPAAIPPPAPVIPTPQEETPQ